MNELTNGIKRHGNTKSFSEQSLGRLLVTMKDKSYAEGSHLFWEGDTADQIFYIKRGRVKVTKSTDEGKELILYLYGHGDLVGQADPFFSSRHSFSAEVIKDSEVGFIDNKELEMLICQHCDFALDFMKWMGIHHRLTQTKIRDLMMYGKPGALASTLIRLSNTYGKPLDDGAILIHKKITHTDLSSMIGATRESVNRMLSDFRKQDTIGYENGMIIIKKIAALQEICRCEFCPVEICRI